MNLYKGMLYTQGYLLDPRYADDRPRERSADHRAAGERHERAPVAPPQQYRAATASALACTEGACG